MSHKSWPVTAKRRSTDKRWKSVATNTSDPRTPVPPPAPWPSPPSSSAPDTASPSVSMPEVPGISMPSDGRTPSTKRKRTPEMDQDIPCEVTTSPRKRKFKTRRSTPKDEDCTTLPSVPENISTSAVEGPSVEETSDFQPSLPEAAASNEELQQRSSLKVFYEQNEESYEPNGQGVQDLFDKYKRLNKFRVGGFGRVYTGERIIDSFPVAFKYVKKGKVPYVEEVEGDSTTKVPLEIYLLCKVGAGPDSSSSIVTPKLLDWYDIGPEIVMILERPEPCLDLFDFLAQFHRKGMDQEMAKVFFRQLLDAAIEMEAKGVFHRDIKPENVLIENYHVVNKARFIDFGCGTTFYPEQTFNDPQGTPKYATPEWFRHIPYKASPTTVWQMGLLLYIMLFNRMPLSKEETIGSFREVPIPTRLPDDLRNLLKGCLDKDPGTRFTLNDVINHPWLNS